MENLEFKCYVFYEELTQILFYLEDMMTHMGDPVSCSVSLRLPERVRESERVCIIIGIKEPTALITFRWLMSQ